ncbi:disease resistance-like protein DSC1 [Mangifera indica]|uniref:disease resistance-like protein DSC1 n=1 Tax=Mangifera indica TaxID=29780 RepID=UPI001CF977A0|nr:disease resistance-like protein DSC1 [Mangifera indica]
MASSSTVTSPPVKYDVFISFRGETRYGFTSHLYSALLRAKVDTFMDRNLERGDEIKKALLHTIEKSTISVVVFSQNYASSRWCLDELVKIIECKNRAINEQIVLPIFYHVDPSDIRNGSGTCEEAFAKLRKKCGKNTEKRQIWKKNSEKWRAALREAGKISGYDTKITRCEADLVDEIVKNVLKKLKYVHPSDTMDLKIGLESSITKIGSLLENGSEDHLRILGIWGMSGIGKTTVVEAIFNNINNQFQNSFFLKDIGKESRLNPNKKFILTNRKLDKKKILIVLDDVTSVDQINSLIGNFLNDLGLGSRIIITTRDKRVLQNCDVPTNNLYKVEGLSDPEALELFSWHAFKRKEPISDYHFLSNKVVKYSNGVPLALIICGKYLSNWKGDFKVWESAIDKLQVSPLEGIQKELQVSYNELDGHGPQKDIFLDVACFFKWYGKDFVSDYLVATYEDRSKSDLEYLIDKCLISTTSDEKIIVNDLFQAMARSIVHQEAKYVEERSRLWNYKDISSVLRRNTGTKAVKGICLNRAEQGERTLTIEGFGKMHNLRLFKLHHPHYEENNMNKVRVREGLEFDLGEVRYLCWHGCNLDLLQLKLNTEHLVALDMSHTQVETQWPNAKCFGSLKYINLSHSKHVDSPDFACFPPNLERLILEGCEHLRKISSTIEHLEKLVVLNLRHCKSLKSLPRNIRKLGYLQYLLLSGCSKLDGLLSDDSGEEVYNDPLCFKDLSKLLHVELANCNSLHSLPELPTSLQSVDAHSCELMEATPDLSILCPSKKSVRVNLSNCFNLDQNALQGSIKRVLDEIEKSCCLTRSRACICFPGTEIPECFKFSHQNKGSSVTFKLQRNWIFLSFAVSALVEFRDYENKGKGLEIFYECGDGTTIFHNGSLKSWESEAGPRNVNKDHVFLGYDFLEYDARSSNGDEMSIQFYVKDSNGKCIDMDVCKVKECRFRLLRRDMHNPEEDQPRPKRLKSLQIILSTTPTVGN